MFAFQESFSRAKAWVTELQKQGNPSMETVIALAGNKADLENRRSVAFQVGNIQVFCVYWEQGLYGRLKR
jgi:hypothetical protein